MDLTGAGVTCATLASGAPCEWTTSDTANSVSGSVSGHTVSGTCKAEVPVSSPTASHGVTEQSHPGVCVLGDCVYVCVLDGRVYALCIGHRRPYLSLAFLSDTQATPSLNAVGTLKQK